MRHHREGSVTLQTTGHCHLQKLFRIWFQDGYECLDSGVAEVETDVLFHVACPGHCKTGLDGYRGAKDPVDGAKVIVELATSEKETIRADFGSLRGMK